MTSYTNKYYDQYLFYKTKYLIEKHKNLLQYGSGDGDFSNNHHMTYSSLDSKTQYDCSNILAENNDLKELCKITTNGEFKNFTNCIISEKCINNWKSIQQTVRNNFVKEKYKTVENFASNIITNKGYTYEITEPIPSIYGFVWSVDIKILHNNNVIAKKNLNYNDNKSVSLSSETNLEYKNQKLQQLLYAITIPYCIKNDFKSISMHPITGATQYLAKKFLFKFGDRDEESPYAIDDIAEQYEELYQQDSFFESYNKLLPNINKSDHFMKIISDAEKKINLPHDEKTSEWFNTNRHKIIFKYKGLCTLNIKEEDDESNYTVDIHNTLSVLEKTIEKIYTT